MLGSLESCWQRVLPFAWIGLGGLLPTQVTGQAITPSAEILAERFSIGAGMDPEVVLHRVMDADFALGQIWILEPERLRAFDLDGLLLSEVGRAGAGPGEFLLAARLEVDSLLHVFDPRLTRETVLRPSGDLVEIKAIPRSQVGGSGSSIRLQGGAELVVTTPRFSAHGAGHDPNAHLILFRGSEGDTLLSIRSNGALWQQGSAYGGFDTGFGDSGAWDLGGDSLLALIDGYNGTVLWRCAPHYEPCGQTDLGLKPQPATREDLSRIVEAASAQSRRRLRQEDVIDRPPLVSAARAGVMSKDGKWLWIQNDGDHLGGQHFSVVERGTGLRGRVTFDAPVRVYAVGQDGLLIGQRGQFDETIVTWMEWIRWPPF